MLMTLDQKCQSAEGPRFTLQAVITKLDMLSTMKDNAAVDQLKKIESDIFKAAPTCLPQILTSTERHPPIGIQNLRRSIAEACGIGRIRTTVVHG